MWVTTSMVMVGDGWVERARAKVRIRFAVRCTRRIGLWLELGAMHV